MADYTITDRSTPAQNYVQPGLTRDIYFFLQSELSSFAFDATTREITAITMASGKEAYKVEVQTDEASLITSKTGGGGTYNTSTLKFAFNGLTSANKKISDLLEKNTGLFALVILANGTRRLLGIDFDTTQTGSDWYPVPKMNGGEETTGTIQEGSNVSAIKSTFEFSWSANNTPPFVSTSLDLDVLTTAAE